MVNSKTFSVRINKDSLYSDVNKKLDELKLNILEYVQECPDLEKQMLYIKEFFDFDILPSDKELREFLLSDQGKIRITEDYTNYDPAKCRDGGSYGFWQDLVKTETPGVFRIEYHTTADAFAFCPACGMFTSHQNCEDYEHIDIRTKEKKENETPEIKIIELSEDSIYKIGFSKKDIEEFKKSQQKIAETIDKINQKE